MLKRCGSIAHHENQIDRRSDEPVAARERIEKETLMRRHRLVIGLFIIVGAAHFARRRFRFQQRP